MLLDQNELIPKIKDIIDENTKEVLISSAYIKTSLLKKLESVLDQKDVSIYVRWEISDLINGASDLEVYELCKVNGWKLFRHNQLHAKFILIDNAVVILGSSNYTLSGTGQNKRNIERNYLANLDDQQVNHLLKDYSFSKEINDTIFNKLRSFIEDKAPTNQYEHFEFDEIIFEEGQEEYSVPFTFDQLPPFRPHDNSFIPFNHDHLSFMKDHNIRSHYDYEVVKDFIEKNPISTLIFEFFTKGNSERCQWGKVERLIMENKMLFSLVDNERKQLKTALGNNHRLFNLFCWLEYFNKDKYRVWNREEYLNDPREGTCSLNRL